MSSSDIPPENKDRLSIEPSSGEKNNPPPGPCGQINAGQRRLSRVNDNVLRDTPYGRTADTGSGWTDIGLRTRLHNGMCRAEQTRVRHSVQALRIACLYPI